MDRAGGELTSSDEILAQPSAGAGAGAERRMQVRAYNFWASLLGDRAFPDAADLDPASLPDFGPHGVLLDFSDGMENPAIVWLGAALAEECGAQGAILRLEDVPSRSLLSRITDHYMQILANQAPVGFEAEFVNRHGATILYRGILLPFTRDQAAIDCIYGVINWKEQAAAPAPATGPATAPALSRLAPPREREPVTDWADSIFLFPEEDTAYAQAESLDEATLHGLRALAPRSPEELGHRSEFTLLVARRNAAGELILLGEVAGDEALLGRAARHLLG
ncbi:hypothetical protein [Novosphingobium sp. TCA1]|uniref:hypothetical protein n=1 Tax=Novosphingobium sp. TCA1 TaxID=2682474 RepID=UPI001309797D|nr:hypothetical protein NTCA1_35700 [Novosphingobium sp. TCA1]